MRTTFRSIKKDSGLGNHSEFGQSRALTKCITDRTAALKRLAEAARRVDKAAFGDKTDFGPVHQALLKALDEAAEFF